MEILDNKEILDNVETAIRAFANDPADSQFQQGYLAALSVMHQEITGTKAEWVAVIMHKNGLEEIVRTVMQ